MPLRADASHDEIAAYRLIKIEAVLDIVPTTRQTLYRWMESGDFPKPIKLGKSSIGFREIEVIAWLNARPRALGGDAAPRLLARRVPAP